MLDTENKLRNALGVGDELNVVSLLPDGLVSQDDLENWASVYFDFEYDPTPVAPTAAFVYSPGALNPLQYFFYDQSGGSPMSWAWNFGDLDSGAQNLSTLQNPSHNFTAFGTFTVTLTATNAEGEDSISQFVVTVNPGLAYVPNNYHAARMIRRLAEQHKLRGGV